MTDTLREGDRVGVPCTDQNLFALGTVIGLRDERATVVVDGYEASNTFPAATLLRVTEPAATPAPSASATPVTATEIEALALEYDRTERGGVGRGDIDLELAEKLAEWFNARILSTGLANASKESGC